MSQHSSLRTNTKGIFLVRLTVLNYTSEKTLQSKPEICQHGGMWVRQQYGQMNCSLIEQTFTKALKIQEGIIHLNSITGSTVSYRICPAYLSPSSLSFGQAGNFLFLSKLMPSCLHLLVLLPGMFPELFEQLSHSQTECIS